MAHIKVFARRSLIVAAFVGFFSIASTAAFAAAGYALSLGSTFSH